MMSMLRITTGTMNRVTAASAGPCRGSPALKILSLGNTEYSGYFGYETLYVHPLEETVRISVSPGWRLVSGLHSAHILAGSGPIKWFTIGGTAAPVTTNPPVTHATITNPQMPAERGALDTCAT